MANDEANKLSQEQEQWLSHEAFIARVLKERAPQAAPSKPVWQRILESAGGAALITVVIGGMAGAWISNSIQSRSRRHEFQLIAYRDFLGKRDEFEKQLQSRVGSSIAAAEDLVNLRRPTMLIDPKLPEATKTRLTEVKEKTTAAFNHVESDWRTQNESLEFLISYYYPSEKDIPGRWATLQSSLSSYLECAGKWYDTHQKSDDTSLACKEEKTTLQKSSRLLQSAFEGSRRYAWEDLEEALERPKTR